MNETRVFVVTPVCICINTIALILVCHLVESLLLNTLISRLSSPSSELSSSNLLLFPLSYRGSKLTPLIWCNTRFCLRVNVCYYITLTIVNPRKLSVLQLCSDVSNKSFQCLLQPYFCKGLDWSSVSYVYLLFVVLFCFQWPWQSLDLQTLQSGAWSRHLCNQ